jgi:hypothetical protein
MFPRRRLKTFDAAMLADSANDAVTLLVEPIFDS